MTKRIAGFCLTLAGLTLFGVAMTGCSSGNAPLNTLEQELAAREVQIENLQNEVEVQRAAAENAQNAAERAAAEAREARLAGESKADTGVATLLPPNARPGECFARVLVPEVYASVDERVLVRAASHRIEVVPARYETVEETVLKKEASERLEVVPATYEWAEERVLVKPASKKLVEVPAEYVDVEEKILVSPARTYWKKGRGPVERVDNATGEIMCLIEEPAVYDTVIRRDVKTPASTREIEIPAEYKTVKRQVVKTPAATRTITVPAEYESISVRKLVEREKEKRIDIPAEYKNVTKRQMVEESYLEWRPVVCETNMTDTGVRELQRALRTAGHDPGPIDGIYGKLTQKAVKSFQAEKGLATGGLTLATVEALGVSFRSGR